MSDLHKDQRAPGLRGRAQPHLGMGLTISITVLTHRQGPQFLSLIKQVTGGLGRASLDSQIGVDGLCGKAGRERETEGGNALGDHPTLGSQPPTVQVPVLSYPPSSDTQILVLRPCLSSLSWRDNVPAHLP